VAFFSSGAGRSLATAYRLTARQFSDVHAQEMWRVPGADLDLAPLLETGRHAVGPGRYETLHVAGELDGLPVLTFSAPDVAALGLRPPAPAYLATMVRGLRAVHELDDGEVVDYLLERPGTVPGWEGDAVREVVRSVAES
jgi:hypothetical protein